MLVLTLYSMQDSGNCYKPRLLLAHLGRPFRIVEIDANDGATRSDGFLALNPNGKVPLMVFDGGRRLAESNAMLLHLAEGTHYLPAHPFDRAKAYEWLFFEQYSHEPAIAVRRSLLKYPQRAAEADEERMKKLRDAGNRALAVMEGRLGEAEWLAGPAYSVADIALYGYTHMADEGGFDLRPFPAVRAWLARVAAQPGHVPLGWRP
jgi:glutathione S-transferase